MILYGEQSRVYPMLTLVLTIGSILGGLGIQKVTAIAAPAFTSSCNATAHLTEQILL